MNESNQDQLQQVGNYVALLLYKVPNKYHDEIVQINKESNDLFKDHGIINYQVFQLNNNKNFEGEDMEAFTNITNLIQVSQDEELWVEMASYRNPEHAKEVISRLEKDERMQPLYQRFLKIVTPGSKVAIGEFDRLNL